jgi:hypothetical protein
MEFPREIYYLIASHMEYDEMLKLYLLSKRMNKMYSSTEFGKYLGLTTTPHECIKHIIKFTQYYEEFLEYLTEQGIGVFTEFSIKELMYLDGVRTEDLHWNIVNMRISSIITGSLDFTVLNLLFHELCWLFDNDAGKYLTELELPRIIWYFFAIRAKRYELFKYILIKMKLGSRNRVIGWIDALNKYPSSNSEILIDFLNDIINDKVIIYDPLDDFILSATVKMKESLTQQQ